MTGPAAPGASAPDDVPGRRPLASRQWRASQRLAAALAARGASPNGISVAGMAFGLLAGAAFWATSRGGPAWPWWLAGALGVQLRLLCNLLDGMVAVEGGRRSAVGELYNEVPDRVSDAATLVGLGYAAGSVPVLGWAAAAVALFVAYVRAAGVVAGARQAFHGPMAKPHRMAAATLAALVAAAAPAGWRVPAVALAGIVAGGLVTAVRRLAVAAADLRAARPL